METNQNTNETELEGGMGASWPPPGGEAAPAAPAPAPKPEAKPTQPKPQPQVEQQKDVIVEIPATEAQQQNQFEYIEGEGYDLKFPDYLPISEQTPERTEVLRSFAAMAPEAGLPADFAQSAVDAYMDVAVAIPYSMEIEYATPEDAHTEMERL